MLDEILILLGRFHPLIIHLPIGFIVLGLLIELNKKKLGWSKEGLKFIFFWASLSGLFALVSGFLQYKKEGYLWDSIQGHLIAGIATVILSFTFYLHLKENSFLKFLGRRFFTIGHVLLISVTGHLGGNITHGEEHLLEPINKLVGISPSIQQESIKYYDDYVEELVFSTLIQPILNDKCVKCHNDNKSKGGLKMHSAEALKRGGKNGSVLNFEAPKLSEILVRIHLPLEEKKHMPPRSGKQLAREEIEVLNRWINEGSSFSQRVNDFKLGNELMSFFFSTQKPFYPNRVVSPPDPIHIEKIRSNNLAITPIDKISSFFAVSAVNFEGFRDADLSLFEAIKPNIVSLDLTGSSITDSIFVALRNFPNLTSLKLNNTQITGQELDQIAPLQNLKRLYLVNTSFDEKFIETLVTFKALERVYLFQEKRSLNTTTSIIPSNKIKIFDFGNYTLDNL
tara:strand:+ start:11999 stop:13357 length:1359 start_codon:yes stop_codon:yes gene_type:complete